MKKVLFLSIVFMLMCSSLTDAQFSGLGRSLLKTAQNAATNAISKAVEKKVEQKVTEKADTILSKAIDNLGKSRKDSLTTSPEIDQALQSADSARAILRTPKK